MWFSLDRKANELFELLADRDFKNMLTMRINLYAQCFKNIKIEFRIL